MSGLNLMVRRHVAAPPHRLFAAWTTPELLLEWWGPDGAGAIDAEVDLRAGGAWRIANKMPDGSVLWIGGVFESVTPPGSLVYSWRPENSDAPPERVMVTFRADGTGTEITVLHEYISNETLRSGHETGWQGCLQGLAAFAEVRRADG
jgi:uncharacterized protein YndB with AHSA1/START domain